MVYDDARERLVMVVGVTSFGDENRTLVWEHSRGAWVQRTAGSAPSGRQRFAIAHDARRQWEWDGAFWQKHAPPVVPSPRTCSAMAYDAARDRTVLFGGYGNGHLADTWEWDGQVWTQRSPAVSPPPRSEHALAYDSVRGRVVLFGGVASAGAFTDTWEWDGATWRHGATASVAGPRQRHGMAYDSARQRVVLVGGFDSKSGNALSGTFEWDGTTWRARTPVNNPPPGAPSGMAYDSGRRRVVLRFRSATWEWDGTNWTELRDPDAPTRRGQHALAADVGRSRVVLFGGDRFGLGSADLNDTWEWDGRSWTFHVPQLNPPSLALHAMAYDPNFQDVLLFGGRAAGSLQSQTWSWNGLNWSLLSTGLSPSAREAHAMASDSGRARIVLFGGRDGAGNLLDDTWEWAGVWIQRTAATSPPARGAVLLSPRTQSVFSCLLVDLSVFVPLPSVANAAGAAALPLPVPDDIVLVGGELWAQLVAVDLQSSLAFASPLKIRIGG